MTAARNTARGSGGRFIPSLGMRGHLNPKGAAVSNNVIASKDVIVHDEVLNIDRQVLAGQAVPPDLVDAYYDKVGGKPSDADSNESETKSPSSRSRKTSATAE